MNYNEGLHYLQELTKFGFNLGLGRIEELMRRLGDPHLKLKAIHVGGTNGKGSTVAMISGILQSAGYRVGVFTSPHLHSYTERYRINDKYISEDEMARYITLLRPHLEKMVEEGFEHPTEFEVCTALAFLYFYQEKVDYVALEVGLGGAIDSTNIVNPLISVITNVAMDHMDYLGNSVKEIAGVKAGIIKPKGVCITAVDDSDALAVIRQVAAKQGALLREVHEIAHWDIQEATTGGQVFDLRTANRAYENLRLNLLGAHQVVNAATAILCVEELEGMGIKIGPENIQKGIASVNWPARLEIVREKPLVVIDGAHNVHGAQSLSKALKNVFTYNKLTLVFGMLGDKEREKVIRELAPMADRVVVTKPNSPRAGEWEKIADEVRKYVSDVIIVPDIREAVQKALATADQKDMVCITGSLYMVAEAREFFVEF